MYDASLQLIDIWSAPLVPVVCVLGSGVPAQVGFGYRAPWPGNMEETPCSLRYEDGDQTVPLRSAEDVCRAWQRQRRCHSPLSTAHESLFRGKTSECVEVSTFHCRAHNMESVDAPRGAERCAELHSRILNKVPVLDYAHIQSWTMHYPDFDRMEPNEPQ